MAQSIQVKNVSWRHEAIIDWLLANPDVKNLHVLCAQMNVSRSWLSIVMNSDAFKAEYIRRRDEYNQLHAGAVQQKLYRASELALDRLIESLAGDEVDPRLALDAVDKTTNRLGFGPQKGNAPVVQVQGDVKMHVVDSSLLASAREKMRQVIDVEAEPLLAED